MCGMMWPKEHETCLPTDAAHTATGETLRQLNDERFHVTNQFYFLYRKFDSLQADYPNLLTCKNEAAAVKNAFEQEGERREKD